MRGAFAGTWLHVLAINSSLAFADFKSLQVPQLRGSINGIFSRDFRDDFDVFIINSAGDINFDITNVHRDQNELLSSIYNF